MSTAQFGSDQLTGTYANADELRADLQARINGDSSLKAAGVAVDVEYDTAPTSSISSRANMARSRR
jgi:hypothetical protein